MSNRLLAAVALVLAAAASPSLATQPAEQGACDRDRPIQLTQAGQSRSWCFTGTARIISDTTERETWWPVGGLVYADSRAEAMEAAKEAGRADAAVWGRVLSVNISSLN